MADSAQQISAMNLGTSDDPEIVAIGKVNEALGPLDPEVRQRVLRWAVDKFNVKLLQTQKVAQTHNGTRGEEADEIVPAVESPASFADFASLYDAANPSTESDKALVAGYWLQIIQGTSDWSGFSANKELRNLGHGVENITVALGALIDSTPRLVMQTHKAGKTKQARKKYKVTGEGIKRVKQMMAGTAEKE